MFRGFSHVYRARGVPLAKYKSEFRRNVAGGPNSTWRWVAYIDYLEVVSECVKSPYLLNRSFNAGWAVEYMDYDNI